MELQKKCGGTYYTLIKHCKDRFFSLKVTYTDNSFTNQDHALGRENGVNLDFILASSNSVYRTEVAQFELLLNGFIGVFAVERRRRDKINNWIVTLSKIIPDCNMDNTKTGAVSNLHSARSSVLGPVVPLYTC